MTIEPFPDHIEIATRQLNHALALYMDGGDLICALTLAGAAEEILGDLARDKGKTPEIERRSLRAKEFYEVIFPDAPKVKMETFITLKNEPRNMMKHKKPRPESGLIDLNRHAGLMLKRAIENFSLAAGPKTKQMRDFESERLRREKSDAVAKTLEQSGAL